MKSSLRALLRDYLPPIALRAASGLRDRIRPASFEFIGHSWPAQLDVPGWDAAGVQESREQTWAAFVRGVEETTLMGLREGDLDLPHAMGTEVQNLYLAFGYCLARACHMKREASVLDWGGSVGNYYVIARHLMPEVALAYHCADLASTCDVGRRLCPDVQFHASADTWATQTYDLVFSSSSLQYLPDWRPMVTALIAASRGYLYVTRMPFITRGASFVNIQRVPGYRTSYPGWVLNRDEFVDFVEHGGMRLARQFVNHVGPRIKGAPRQNLYMGFLFER